MKSVSHPASVILVGVVSCAAGIVGYLASSSGPVHFGARATLQVGQLRGLGPIEEPESLTARIETAAFKSTLTALDPDTRASLDISVSQTDRTVIVFTRAGSQDAATKALNAVVTSVMNGHQRIWDAVQGWVAESRPEKEPAGELLSALQLLASPPLSEPTHLVGPVVRTPPSKPGGRGSFIVGFLAALLAGVALRYLLVILRPAR